MAQTSAAILTFVREIPLGHISNPNLIHEFDNSIWIHGTDPDTGEQISKFAFVTNPATDDFIFIPYEPLISPDAPPSYLGVAKIPRHPGAGFHMTDPAPDGISEFVLPILSELNDPDHFKHR